MTTRVPGEFRRLRYQGLWTVKHGQTERQAIISWDAVRRHYQITLSPSTAYPFYLSSRETAKWLKGGKGRRVHR